MCPCMVVFAIFKIFVCQKLIQKIDFFLTSAESLQATSSMYVCMDVCLYVCMYVCIYVYVCVCRLKEFDFFLTEEFSGNNCIYVCFYLCMHVSINVWMGSCIYMYVYIYIYVCVCVCVYIYICMYVYIMVEVFNFFLMSSKTSLDNSAYKYIHTYTVRYIHA